MQSPIEEYRAFLAERQPVDHNVACGFGIRRQKDGETLDVWFPVVVYDQLSDFESVMTFVAGDNVQNSFEVFDFKTIERAEALFLALKEQGELSELAQSAATVLKQCQKEFSLDKNHYAETDFIYFQLAHLDQPVASAEEGYLKLHLLSTRAVTPHGVNVEGLFGKLTNVAWTNYGPVLPKHLDEVRLKHHFSDRPLHVTHVDKFPYMVNYHVPSGVRIADGGRARLGAHLAEGTTIMPAGYVNFNAGTLGHSMVEGRISAGVEVGDGTDLGGGSSIMGTLSGGGKEVIVMGKKCLLGANSGTGISLGDGCTVAAGLYLTAGTKVSLYDDKKQPINLKGDVVNEGENVVKALDLNGKDNLLFMQDSQTGQVTARPNFNQVELNSILHSN